MAGGTIRVRHIESGKEKDLTEEQAANAMRRGGFEILDPNAGTETQAGPDFLSYSQESPMTTDNLQVDVGEAQINQGQPPPAPEFVTVRRSSPSGSGSDMITMTREEADQLVSMNSSHTGEPMWHIMDRAKTPPDIGTGEKMARGAAHAGGLGYERYAGVPIGGAAYEATNEDLPRAQGRGTASAPADPGMANREAIANYERDTADVRTSPAFILPEMAVGTAMAASAGGLTPGLSKFAAGLGATDKAFLAAGLGIGAGYAGGANSAIADTPQAEPINWDEVEARAKTGSEMGLAMAGLSTMLGGGGRFMMNQMRRPTSEEGLKLLHLEQGGGGTNTLRGLEEPPKYKSQADKVAAEYTRPGVKPKGNVSDQAVANPAIEEGKEVSRALYQKMRTHDDSLIQGMAREKAAFHETPRGRHRGVMSRTIDELRNIIKERKRATGKELPITETKLYEDVLENLEPRTRDGLPLADAKDLHKQLLNDQLTAQNKVYDLGSEVSELRGELDKLRRSSPTIPPARPLRRNRAIKPPPESMTDSEMNAQAIKVIRDINATGMGENMTEGQALGAIRAGFPKNQPPVRSESELVSLLEKKEMELADWQSKAMAASSPEAMATRKDLLDQIVEAEMSGGMNAREVDRSLRSFDDMIPWARAQKKDDKDLERIASAIRSDRENLFGAERVKLADKHHKQIQDMETRRSSVGLGSQRAMQDVPLPDQIKAVTSKVNSWTTDEELLETVKKVAPELEEALLRTRAGRAYTDMTSSGSQAGSIRSRRFLRTLGYHADPIFSLVNDMRTPGARGVGAYGAASTGTSLGSTSEQHTAALAGTPQGTIDMLRKWKRAKDKEQRDKNQ